ncbi:hypothetical protein LTS02_017942 [Friedmanniomyces endolithicus]|nr:hypothetical protein LTS02_017942 [Friedmanniomyces endolithicus]
MLTNKLVVSIEQAKSNSSSRETATTTSPTLFSGGQADMVSGMERSAIDNGEPEEREAQQPARATQTYANGGTELIGMLPDALRNAHATPGDLERDGAQRDEIYLGKLVQEIKANRNTLPEIAALALRADQTSEQAQQLEQQAEAAREAANDVAKELQAAREHEDRFAVKEYELRQAEQQLQKLRSELAID